MTLGEAEVVLSEVPPGKWVAIQGWLVPFAKKLGYRPFYDAYRTKRHFSRAAGAFEEEEGDEVEREEEE
jgi:hypothetical protein